jgi:hypothetical protein
LSIIKKLIAIKDTLIATIGNYCVAMEYAWNIQVPIVIWNIYGICQALLRHVVGNSIPIELPSVKLGFNLE